MARQTYQRIEHIVIDGGSTDGTRELIEAHRPPYPYAWMSEPDGGMYEALNKGLSMAQGEVFAYLNSDDLYLPWSVEVALLALRHPGTDLVYGDMGILRPATEGRPSRFNLLFYPEFDLRHFTFVDALGQPTVFWRRSVTDRIGDFDTGYRLIADCEYWLRAALSGATLRHVPELLALQVEHGTTLRATHQRRLGDEFRTLRVEMSRFVEPPGSLRWQRLKASAFWRIRQIEFFAAMRGKKPDKWPRFVDLLHAHGISAHARDLKTIVPARWRGSASLFGDPRRVYEILLSGPT
jgi:glycosyltransferase involved in cell wall biosynthesis